MQQPAPSPSRILLTGASGFVGTYLRSAVSQSWPRAEVIGVGEASAPGVAGVDLLDRSALEAVVAAARPDVVIHLAGQASVKGSLRDEAATWRVNLGGTLNLALAAAACAPEATFLFASSAEVYGASFLNGPVDESTPLLPMNAYARSKALAERVLADVLPPQARLVVARPFNHTGPGQREDFVLPSFVGQVARIEAGLQPPQLAVGNIEVARDFLDVRDVAAAYVALIAAAPRLPPRFTCNIASERARPLREHLATLTRLARCDFEIVVDPARLRSVDLPVVTGCSRLLHTATGWTPRHDMAQTLADMIDERRARERANEGGR